MLILASTSPYRRQMLERLKLSFRCEAPHIDETPLPDETIPHLVERLSREKARAVARKHPDAWVIGSDQSAMVDGLQLSKPGDYDTAFRQLKKLSGRTVAFHTGLCVCHNGRCETTMDVTETVFRPLSDALIHYYLTQEAPFNCAGGIKSEGLGILLLKAVRNEDPSALIGLPLIRLIDLLEKLNYPFPWQPTPETDG